MKHRQDKAESNEKHLVLTKLITAVLVMLIIGVIGYLMSTLVDEFNPDDYNLVITLPKTAADYTPDAAYYTNKVSTNNQGRTITFYDAKSKSQITLNEYIICDVESNRDDE